MKRFEGLLPAIILVSVTFLLTEWVHYRLEAPLLFQALLGPDNDSEGFANTKNREADSVTESEFQIYLGVLEAMQADHSLPIEKAVAAQHIPLPNFRQLEQRVQRNEVLVDRARHILRERAESLWNERGVPRDHG